MRLKKLIIEQNGELEKLHELLISGDWYFQEPYIYRGTRSASKGIEVKDVSSRKGRKPKDTDKLVDGIIHEFYIECFPNYPARQESVFGSTSESYASNFGDVYVVIPNKQAKISYSPVDPHDLFSNIEHALKKIKKTWENNSDDIVQFFRDEFGTHVHKMQFISSFLCGKDMRFEKNKIPCPEKMVDELRSFIDANYRDLEDYLNVSEMFKHCWHAARMIRKYFMMINIGYPDFNEYPQEFMIDGEYLQVKKEVFDEYKESYL